MKKDEILDAVGGIDPKYIETAAEAKSQTRRKKGWTVVNGLNEDALEELFMKEKPVEKETQTSKALPWRKIVRAACFLVPCLIVLLLFSHSVASQHTQNMIDEDWAKYPTGYPTGMLQTSYVYYNGTLYRAAVGSVQYKDLPRGTVLLGTVQSVDDWVEPAEDFAAAHIPVGTPVLGADVEHPSIIYVPRPNRDVEEGVVYFVHIPYEDWVERNAAVYTGVAKELYFRWSGYPLLFFGDRQWEYREPSLTKKKLGDEYVAAGEVLTQLDDPLSVTDMNEDDFHFPEKEGEAFVFSPGMKIYVLESEKQAPTHLYVQTASDQYVYLFPSLAEIAPAGK